MALDLKKLAQTDPRLAYAFGDALTAAQAHHEKTGKTINWDSLPAPAQGVAPQKHDDETGEPVPTLDSKGRVMSPARLVFKSLRQKYRVRPNNPNGNPVISRKLAAMIVKINAASGVKRGRGDGGGKVDDTTIAAIDADVMVDGI